MSEKLCVFCEYFDWGAVGCNNFSTYPDPPICEKNHIGAHESESIRVLILRAQSCPDYDEAK